MLLTIKCRDCIMKKKGSDAMKPKIRKERTVRLLSNSRRRFFRVVFSRLGIISLLFLFNACVFLAGFFWIEEYLPHFFGGSAVITAVFVLLVLNTDIDATAKITWLVIIMLFPIMGGMFFIYTQSDLGHRAPRMPAYTHSRSRRDTARPRGRTHQASDA